MRAVVVGATGATGREVVAQLLSDPSWTQVTTLGRTRLASLPSAYAASVDLTKCEAEQRLLQKEVDMDALEAHSAAFAGAEAVFVTLGTTRAAAGSAAAYRRIDLTFVDKAAAAAKAAGVPQFLLLTSKGANAGVWYSEHVACHSLFYMHIKGAAEEAAKAHGFAHFSAFRPGMLDRGADMATRSWGEALAARVLPTTHVADVARAMIATAKRNAGQPPAPPAVYETF